MIRNALIVVFMGLMSEGATALSLGAPQGTVWLGQPIDLGFEVQLDPGMSVDALCPQARLVSGDVPVSAGRVQVSVLPGEQERNLVVRVQSPHLADEPVLTAQVSIHCTGRVTREYIFLADLPATVVPGARPVAIPWGVPVPEASPSRSANAAAGEGVSVPETGAALQRRASVHGRAARKVARPSSKATARAPSGGVVAVAPAASAAQPEQPKPSRAAPPATASAEALAGAIAQTPASSVSTMAPAMASTAAGLAKPRLVMEPLTTLVTPPESGEPAPSDTVGAGPAQSSAPESNALDGAGTHRARMQTLQVEIEHMRAQAEQDHHATLALLARMEQLNAGHFPASLVYGLLALLALTVAAAGWGVIRMRRALDTSNEEWRNTLTAYVAQSSLPLVEDGVPQRHMGASLGEGRPTGLAALHGAGALPA